jgi:hypothetical protein
VLLALVLALVVPARAHSYVNEWFITCWGLPSVFVSFNLRSSLLMGQTSAIS